MAVDQEPQLFAGLDLSAKRLGVGLPDAGLGERAFAVLLSPAGSRRADVLRVCEQPLVEGIAACQHAALHQVRDSRLRDTNQLSKRCLWPLVV